MISSSVLLFHHISVEDTTCQPEHLHFFLSFFPLRYLLPAREEQQAAQALGGGYRAEQQQRIPAEQHQHARTEQRAQAAGDVAE